MLMLFTYLFIKHERPLWGQGYPFPAVSSGQRLNGGYHLVNLAVVGYLLRNLIFDFNCR